MTHNPMTRFYINLTRIATVSLLLMGALVLWGCDQQSGVKTEKTAKIESEAQTESGSKVPSKAEATLNAALDAMAKDVAAALNHKQVRVLIKKKAGPPLLAGERNILFENIASQKVQGMERKKKAMTFEQVLARQRVTRSGKSVQEAVAGVREDAKAIPKFDIGVQVNYESWNAEKHTPLVAFHHKQQVDDTELERVKAYDAKGNVHWLDAREAPNRPVVVVGINERTDKKGNVLEAFEAYQSTDEKGTTNDIKIEPPGGGGGGEDSREYGDNEYLERVKVKEDHEPWVKEDPEVKLDIKSETSIDLLSRSLNRDGGGPFGDDTSWNTYNGFAFQWTQADIGSYSVWAFHERDPGDVTLFTVVWKDKEYSFSYTDDSEKMGHQIAQFGVDDDQVFDTGDVEFENESKNP